MSFYRRADETEKVICGERWIREPDNERRQRDREASNVRVDHLGKVSGCWFLASPWPHRVSIEMQQKSRVRHPTSPHRVVSHSCLILTPAPRPHSRSSSSPTRLVLTDAPLPQRRASYTQPLLVLTAAPHPHSRSTSSQPLLVNTATPRPHSRAS
ncbi:hypothetical protein Q7C36_002755 [Tachysurus vachellii]|uniref:Uncharacterized protein n=1 Tax=Tachysurus vachellii TaxID=175792 RepID=A0AA88NYP6_TACVA|nr:hypothetical protein Q7C36_002755 [Tachysurus vachellii]